MSESLYLEREHCVIALARSAQANGYRVGFRDDPALPDPQSWPVLFIDLPTGQVSWHLSRIGREEAKDIGHYDGEWDGHDVEEKYRRLTTWRP